MPKRNSFTSEQAREAARKRWAKPKAEAELDESPAETLHRIRLDPSEKGYVRVAAAAKLLTQPDEAGSQAWRDSPQVRPDYRPPTLADVALVAADAGAIQLCGDCVARLRAEKEREGRD